MSEANTNKEQVDIAYENVDVDAEDICLEEEEGGGEEEGDEDPVMEEEIMDENEDIPTVTNPPITGPIDEAPAASTLVPVIDRHTVPREVIESMMSQLNDRERALIDLITRELGAPLIGDFETTCIEIIQALPVYSTEMIIKVTGPLRDEVIRIRPNYEHVITGIDMKNMIEWIVVRYTMDVHMDIQSKAIVMAYVIDEYRTFLDMIISDIKGDIKKRRSGCHCTVL